MFISISLMHTRTQKEPLPQTYPDSNPLLTLPYPCTNIKPNPNHIQNPNQNPNHNPPN